MSVYLRIPGPDWRTIWVTGDLHGCHPLLQQKLQEAGFDTTQDLLISVGDLADRGEENIECLSLLKQPWFRAVRGNHEQFLLEYLRSGHNENEWLCNGGSWFFDLRDAEREKISALLPLIDALPLVIEVTTQGKTTVICHADYPGDHYAYGKPVNEEIVLWSRDRITASGHGRVKTISGADQFVFGHTPLKRPLQFANQHYIDTGAVFTGNLTLLQIQ